MRACSFGLIAIGILAGGPAYGQQLFDFRAVRRLTLKPEPIDIALANDEFIPSTHSSELALSADGTLIAYASSTASAIR